MTAQTLDAATARTTPHHPACPIRHGALAPCICPAPLTCAELARDLADIAAALDPSDWLTPSPDLAAALVTTARHAVARLLDRVRASDATRGYAASIARVTVRAGADPYALAQALTAQARGIAARATTYAHGGAHQ